MRSDPDSRSDLPSFLGWSLLTLVFIVLGVGGLHVASAWWQARPANMLDRFLDVRDDEVSNLRMDYQRGLDFTARIYFESDKATTDRIIGKRGFRDSLIPPSPRVLGHLRFSGAPDPRSAGISCYTIKRGSVDEYLAISTDGTRLWYCAQDY